MTFADEYYVREQLQRTAADARAMAFEEAIAFCRSQQPAFVASTPAAVRDGVLQCVINHLQELLAKDRRL